MNYSCKKNCTHCWYQQTPECGLQFSRDCINT